MKKKEALTQKQKMFCLEYLKSFNATDAYKKVYWASQKVAEVNWCKLLSNTKVAEYLASKTQQKTEKLDVWVDTDKVENDTSIQFKIVSFKKWEK